MPTDRAQKRIDVLLGWRATAGGGPELPAAGDLVKIGAAGAWDIPHVDRPAARRWQHVLDFLITQVNFGVHDPVEQMTDDMRSPLPDAALPATPAPGDGPSRADGSVVLALLAWRRARERTEPGVRGLKEHHFKAISRHGRRTEADIVAHLPADVRRFAGELADVVAGVLGPRAVEVGPGTGPMGRDGAGEADPAVPAGDRTEPAVPSPGSAATGAAGGAVPPPERSASGGRPPAPPVPPVAAATAEENGPFAPYDFPSDPPPPGPVVASIGTDGTAELSWDAAPGAWVVYRVVTSDRVVPFSPDPLDEADEIDCLSPTSVPRVVDERPFTAALRHVTVWCHSGPDRSGALRSAPSLHAATSVVAPVVDVRISEDEGRVLGRWTALPGTSAVQVERVRIDRTGPNARAGGRNSVPADLDGFTDDRVEPGGRYRYLVRAAVRDGDQHEELSQAQVHAVTVTAALDPVTDLDWRARPGGGLVDLVWKAPRLGRVEVYRTQGSPTMGTRGELLDDATLPSAGLPAAAVLDNRRATTDGRTEMPGVSWPAGWTKVYLTPVTTGGGLSRIGTTVVATRTDPPQDPRLVERTDHQLLTFEWPQGAAAVEVYQGVRREVSDHVTGGEPVATVTEEDYRGQGGLQFAPPLEPLGCSLHLVAVSWSRNKAVRSEPVAVDYPGLLRIRYQLVPKRGRGQTGRRGTPAVTVQVWADSDVVPPPLALVHHPTRMPLAVDDPGSVALGVVEEGSGHTGWRIQAPRLGPATGTEWSADLPSTGGWLRLFVDLYPAAWELIDSGELTPVAVLDPPAPTLWSGPNGARP